MFRIDRNDDQTPKVVSRAIIIGIGVDTLYLPRLLSLLTRQSKRIRMATNGVSKSSTTSFFLATQRFAKRILNKDEYSEWKGKFDERNIQTDSISREETIWLASR